MREYTFILPKTDNDGAPLIGLHCVLHKKLCDMFGGFTAVECSGGWIDSLGNVIIDHSVRYTVATDNELAEQFRDLAIAFGVSAKQQAVYFVNGLGEVEIIDTSKPVACVAEYNANFGE